MFWVIDSQRSNYHNAIPLGKGFFPFSMGMREAKKSHERKLARGDKKGIRMGT